MPLNPSAPLWDDCSLRSWQTSAMREQRAIPETAQPKAGTALGIGIQDPLMSGIALPWTPGHDLAVQKLWTSIANANTICCGDLRTRAPGGPALCAPRSLQSWRWMQPVPIVLAACQWRRRSPGPSHANRKPQSQVLARLRLRRRANPAHTGAGCLKLREASGSAVFHT